MNRNLPLVLAILLLLNGGAAFAADNKAQTVSNQEQENEYNESKYFPKKGNYLDWLEANRLSNQGVRLARTGNCKGAIPMFQQAIQRYGYDYTYYENLAVALHRTGNLERAESTTEIAAKMSPGRWSPWYNLGVILTKEHEYKRALIALKKAKALKAPANKLHGINELITALQCKISKGNSGTISATASRTTPTPSTSSSTAASAATATTSSTVTPAITTERSGSGSAPATAAPSSSTSNDISNTSIPANPPTGSSEEKPAQMSPYTTVPEVSPVPADPAKTNEKGN